MQKVASKILFAFKSQFYNISGSANNSLDLTNTFTFTYICYKSVTLGGNSMYCTIYNSGSKSQGLDTHQKHKVGNFHVPL